MQPISSISVLLVVASVLALPNIQTQVCRVYPWGFLLTGRLGEEGFEAPWEGRVLDHL